jgi:hypothetical protein
MLDGEFFRFESVGGAWGLVSCSESVSEVNLAVADSFLVEDGRVRSLDSHYNRFSGWVADAAPDLAKHLPAFLSQVSAKLPATGRWFPRIELHGGAGETQALFLRLRTAPEQLGSLTLWTLDEPDPRSRPEVKGPDLSLCMQLRRRAQLHSADETVILSDSDLLVEGALSALVWWDGDKLLAPGKATRWLPSVTRDEVLQIAESTGHSVELSDATPAQLEGCEIWALSSLHGIRVVENWVNGPRVYAVPGRAEGFQRRLRMLASSVS